MLKWRPRETMNTPEVLCLTKKYARFVVKLKPGFNDTSCVRLPYCLYHETLTWCIQKTRRELTDDRSQHRHDVCQSLTGTWSRELNAANNLPKCRANRERWKTHSVCRTVHRPLIFLETYLFFYLFLKWIHNNEGEYSFVIWLTLSCYGETMNRWKVDKL